MHDPTSWIFFGSFCLLLILVVAPLRVAAGWFLKTAIGPFFAALKSLLHTILRAHANVLRNFQPRTRIYYELNRRRTSHTED